MSRACSGVFSAIILFSSFGSGQAEPLSLDEALGVAYTTNPQLEAAREGQKTKDEGVTQAEANLRPTIGAVGTYGYETLDQSFFGTQQQLDARPITAGVQLSQSIYRGGRTAAEIGRAKALVMAGRAQLTQTEESVLLNAAAAYFNVVRDQANLQSRLDAVAALQKELEGVDTAHKVGELTRTDVAQSEARLADAQSNLAVARAQLQVSRVGFERVVGRPAETLQASPPLPKLPRDEQEAISLASNTSPPVVAARETVKAADYAVTDSYGNGLPSLSVDAQYQFVQDSLTSVEGTGAQKAFTVIGQLTIPIYQGGAEESIVRQAIEQRSQAELQLTDTQRQALDDARTAWQAYEAAGGAISSYSREVDADNIAFQGVQEEQRAGSRTVLDVLNAEQELLNAQIALASSERDLHVAAYEILSAVGWLTAQKLALKVPIYDPATYYKENESRWFGVSD